MKNIGSYAVLAFTLLCLAVSPASAQFSPRGFDPSQRDEMFKQQLESQGVTLPSDWDTMTQEERRAFMEENGIQLGGPGGRRPQGNGNFDPANRGAMLRQFLERQGISIPGNWDAMTAEEQQTYMQESGLSFPQGRGLRGDLPSDWDTMTDEERRTYMEENRPQKGSVRAKNYTRNARKATRYQKFTGTLREKKTFTDSAKIRNRQAVEFLQQRGIIDGNSDGSFNPQGAINRAESLKVLLEALKEKTVESDSTVFLDVPIGAWYTKYINQAYKLGIVKGYQDGSFRPGKTVNQAELLKIAFETFGIDLTDYPVTDLPDGVETNAWYAPYLQYALDNNLLDADAVDPASGMTRELFSELIYRLIQQQESL